jgi:hypothetical protein
MVSATTTTKSTTYSIGLDKVRTIDLFRIPGNLNVLQLQTLNADQIPYVVEDLEPPIAEATGANPTNIVPIVIDTCVDTDAEPLQMQIPFK